MNITVLANRDIASYLALSQLLPGLRQSHTISVFLSSRVGGSKPLAPALQELGAFEAEILAGLRSPVSPDIPQRLDSINSEQGLAVLASTAPELVLSIRYGGILRKQAIALPPLGVINLHSGLLPDYRGVMATFHAIRRGETRIGTTLHYISDANIDTGAVIDHTYLTVQSGRSYFWHVLNLYPEACLRLLGCVEALANGQMPQARPQPPGGNYYSFPDQTQLLQFQQSGHELYNVSDARLLADFNLE